MSEQAVVNLYEGNRTKQLIKAIFRVSIPIAIQSVVTSALGMLDIIMLGHLGNRALSTASVTAASQGNRSFFIIFLIYFGFCAGASIFFSRFYGKKDYKGMQRILGLVLTICLILSLIPFFWSLFFSKQVMSFFITKSGTKVLELGAQYISIVGLTFPLFAASMLYGFALRSMGNSRTPMMASIVALLTNAIMNYFLIYGFGPIPMMGVKGSAIGTFVARVIELGFLLIYIYTRKEHPLKVGFKSLFAFTKYDFKAYFKTAAFVIFEESFWGTAMMLQFAMIGKMGVKVAASYSLIGPFIELSLMQFVAIAHGSSIIIGNLIGQNSNKQEIRWASWKCIQISLVMGIIVALIFGFIPYYLLPVIYNVAFDVIDLARITLVVFSFCLLYRGVELVGSIGVLRGGGDTFFTMTINILGAWFIMLPIVYFTGFVLKLPLNYVIGFSSIYEFSISIFVFFRIRRGNWVKILS
jgi:putative MATE family efflux protein